MGRYHIHRSYELFYLFSGERGFFIKDRVYPIRAGDLVLIDSNEVHRSIDMGVPNHDRVVLYYDPSFFEKYYPDEASCLTAPFKGSQVIRLSMKDRLKIEAMFREFFRELGDALPGYDLRLRHIAAEMLLQISRMSSRNKSTVTNVTGTVKKTIQEVVRYIEQHYGEKLRLEEMAQQFYISPGYLSRSFKEVTGFSLTDYLNMVRIREAQRLLRETELSITEIAERVGFDNYSHFGKMFKRITSVAPRDYRRQD